MHISPKGNIRFQLPDLRRLLNFNRLNVCYCDNINHYSANAEKQFLFHIGVGRHSFLIHFTRDVIKVSHLFMARAYMLVRSSV